MDDVKSKINKLMAMANDGRGNEFEAEAALRQAEKLMRKHGIDAADLQERTGEKPVYNWIAVSVPAGDKGRPVRSSPLWFGWLISGIGKFTDTKVGYRSDREHGICAEFKGDAIDVEFAVYLCKHLRDECRYKSALFPGARSDKDSFRKAYAARVYDRMETMIAERKAALKAHVTSTGTALAIIDNKIALRDAQYGAQTYGKARTVSMTYSGREAGRAAGDRAGLGRPVGHSQQSRLH